MMNIIEKTVEVMELSEEDICKLYLELRERIGKFKPIEAFPTIHKLYNTLHNFEGKSHKYEKEVYGLIKKHRADDPE